MTNKRAVADHLRTTDDILGPPVLVWRDDPLFEKGHIAAELALAVLRKLEPRSEEYWDDTSQAIEHLESFLEAARQEAAERGSS